MIDLLFTCDDCEWRQLSANWPAVTKFARSGCEIHGKWFPGHKARVEIIEQFQKV
jgi:hypothetical protein